ncbi:MAG: 50S ribosomal protein L5 [Acidimicrobiia bacterium]
MARLRTKYRDELAPKLQEDLGLGNVMQVPTLEKIVLNMGIGEAIADKKAVEEALDELGLISGQKPRINRARKSIANFKLREGMPIGVSVTLRGDRMWEFFDRLLSIAIPRVRDFRGLNPKAFDGHGNYSVGASEQLIFPEIDFDRVTTTRGLNITIVTTAENDEQGKALLDAFGFPFRKVEAQV